jgi:hypothetical protein
VVVKAYKFFNQKVLLVPAFRRANVIRYRYQYFSIAVQSFGNVNATAEIAGSAQIRFHGALDVDITDVTFLVM